MKEDRSNALVASCEFICQNTFDFTIIKNMSTESHETFSRPPIVEALLDIQVDHSKKVTINDLEELHKKVKIDYPESHPINFFQNTIKFTENLPISTSSQDLRGFQLWSSDKQRVVQYRLDGYSFSQLPPYKNWEQVEEESKYLWKMYEESTSPSLIKRIGLRYINSINIPSQNFSLENYIVKPPSLPDGLPNTIEQFYSKVTVPIAELNAKANITIATAMPLPPNITAIILDIEVFISVPFPYNSEKVWSLFSQLRTWKNKIFMKVITDNTKELFK